jgi:hypothetical protein
MGDRCVIEEMSKNKFSSVWWCQDHRMIDFILEDAHDGDEDRDHQSGCKVWNGCGEPEGDGEDEDREASVSRRVVRSHSGQLK